MSATREKPEMAGNLNGKPNSKETAMVLSKVKPLQRRGLTGKYISRDTIKRRYLEASKKGTATLS